MNQKWILSNTKPCPNCHVLIEKNEGCKHMVKFNFNFNSYVGRFASAY